MLMDGSFVTMDAQRLVVMLHEQDALAYTVPIVGMYEPCTSFALSCIRWVAGVSSVNDPYVYAACMRYMFTGALLEKAHSGDGEFLLMLYNRPGSGPSTMECTPVKPVCSFQCD